jgi:hypothetical protein
MDKQKIQELLNRSTLPKEEEFFDFFGVQNKKELAELFIGNLSTLHYQFTDSYTTRIIESVFSENKSSQASILGERISLAIIFITTYSPFDYDLLQLYIYAFGITESAFLLDYALKNDPRYNFLLNLYKEYKSYYFGEAYELILKGVEDFMVNTAKEAQTLDFKELSETLKNLDSKIK